MSKLHSVKYIVLSRWPGNNMGRVSRDREMQTDTESGEEGWGENHSTMQPCVILKSNG